MKDLKISKELIKNILVKETENLSDDFTFDIKDNYILFAADGECQFEVNIYEFAFKCKEWAYIKSNYTLETSSNPFGGFCIIEIYQIDVEKLYNKPDSIYRGKNEIEAIIKACNWILEGLNEKI